ncbi:MAG: hypothetical protein AAB454_00040 [Patescibacteria group bacterium]
MSSFEFIPNKENMDEEEVGVDGDREEALESLERELSHSVSPEELDKSLEAARKREEETPSSGE